jgi:hypothetical protein
MKTRTLLILIMLFCAAMGSVQSVRAATVTVTNTNDSGGGSLRQALADANDSDTIDFSVTGTIALTSGELLVNKSITISGPGAGQLSVNGNAVSRVFHISSGKTVAVSGLTITNGYANGSHGGGIYNDHATLTVNNSTISGNSAVYDGSNGGSGGGIANDGSCGSATLTINNSTISGNSDDYYGGGVYNDGSGGCARLTITNSTISDNYGPGVGSGIANIDGTLTLDNSTLSDNFYRGIANYGSSGNTTITNSTLSGNDGGIDNVDATLTVTNSTLSGNSNGGVLGGGIANQGGTVTVDNSTISGNEVSPIGGGIYNVGGTLTITNSTLSDNSAFSGGGIYNGGMLTIGSTILKTGASGENIFNASGTVTSLGYNLSSDNGGGVLTGPGDQMNTDPMLGPLQNNGGPTFTHELVTGSPAIDVSDPSFTPPPFYDQRGPGFYRVMNGRVDIGSFEVQSGPPPTGTPPHTPTPIPPCTTPTPTPSATPSCAPPPPNMVSWWPGDGDANDIQDSNNGTLIGDTAYASGFIGQEFVLDGNGDGVVIGTAPNLQLQDFTIEMWIKRASTTIATYGTDPAAVLFGYGEGGYALGIFNDGRLFLTRVGIDEIHTSAAITCTNYHHIAVTKSGSTVVFYINGVSYPVGAYTNTFSFDTPAAIGMRGDTADLSFLGSIDEVAVYDRALAGSEIEAVYSGGSTGKCRPPTPACAAQVQPPINADGSSIFNARRGVVPVKFRLTCDGHPTCDLSPATIAVTRTAGGVIGEINESVYSSQADSGSNFRVLECQYHYNLNSRALGVGTYRVDILINGQVIGSATFVLR